MASQKTTLKIKKECKNSVRFDHQEKGKDPEVLSSVYLLNPAWEALGKPTAINLEVSVVKA